MLLCQLDSPHKSSDEPKEVSKAFHNMTFAIANSKRAIILVGAGISTSAGVPDFRGLNGVYQSPASKQVASAGASSSPQDSPYETSSSSSPTSSSTIPPSTRKLKGASLFSASVYSSSDARAEHWKFMAELKKIVQETHRHPSSIKSLNTAYPSASIATPTHAFFKTMSKRGQLKRLYTQNIDGLEVAAGLTGADLEGITLTSSLQSHGNFNRVKGKGKSLTTTAEVVQLHGTIDRIKCTICDYVGEWEDVHTVAFSVGETLECPDCEERSAERARLNKRVVQCRSYLRPSIVLYSESSPASLSIGAISISDLQNSPDLCLVMGTSLRIPGFKKLVKEFGKVVRSKGGLCILVNKEEIGAKEWQDCFDYQVTGTTDDFVIRILDDWKRVRPNDWVQQQTLHNAFAVRKQAGVRTDSAKEKPNPKYDMKTPPRMPLQPLDLNSLYEGKRLIPFRRPFESEDDGNTDGSPSQGAASRSRKRSSLRRCSSENDAPRPVVSISTRRRIPSPRFDRLL